MDLRDIPIQGKDALLYRDGATLKRLLALTGVSHVAFADWLGVTRLTVANWCRLEGFDTLRGSNRKSLIRAIRTLHSAVLARELPVTEDGIFWQDIANKHKATLYGDNALFTESIATDSKRNIPNSISEP